MLIENILFASDFPEDAKDFVLDRVLQYNNFAEDEQIVFVRAKQAYVSNKDEYIVQVFILENMNEIKEVDNIPPFIIFFIGSNINK